jgi:asparagine synthase (glutamine-hydrolysing)
VIDPSPAGAQPMVSHDGVDALTFNGEIYNHLELRRELQLAGNSVGWRGRSDTETLLEAIRAWGITEALRRAVGMFAFAHWNERHQRLTLARDRFGEKPIYYGWHGNTFVFGSELKAIRGILNERLEICTEAAASFLCFGYVPAPLSIYQGFF